MWHFKWFDASQVTRVSNVVVVVVVEVVVVVAVVVGVVVWCFALAACPQ